MDWLQLPFTIFNAVGQSLIGATTDAIKSVAQGIWHGIMSLLAWLLDPVQLVGWGVYALKFLMRTVGGWLPDPMGAGLQDFSDWLKSDMVADCFTVGLYIFSPICKPTVVMGCMAAVMLFYTFSMILKLFTWLLSFAWSSPT